MLEHYRVGLLFLLSASLSCASPFAIEDFTIGSGAVALRGKRLINQNTGELVDVIWEAGGRVEALKLKDPSGSLQNVLLGHGGDAEAIRENKYWKGCLLFPYVNRVANGAYSFYGEQYQLPINEPARNNSIHGFLCNKTMEVGLAQVNQTAATLTLSYTVDGSDEGYPFQLVVSVYYVLDDTSNLSITFGVVNTMESQPALMTFGFHPYFLMQDVSQATVQFDGCSEWNHVEMSEGAPKNGKLIPTGLTNVETQFQVPTAIGGTSTAPTYYDDEWKLRVQPSRCNSVLVSRLCDPLAKYCAELVQDPNFALTQMFTGSMSVWRESAIAFEPMSGMADAFNNHDHLTVLSAGEIWQGTFSIRLSL